MYKKRYGGMRLTRQERAELALYAKSIPPKLLEKFAGAFTPKTYYRWFKDLISTKFDSSRHGSGRGRPPKSDRIEKYVRRVCREHPDWGDETIANNVSRIFEKTCPNTIKNIREKFGIPPAEKRKGHWDLFKKYNGNSIWSCDMFTREIFTQYGLMTYYVLIFIHMETKRLRIAGATIHPNGQWITQMARNCVNIENYFKGDRFLIRDNDPRYTKEFDEIFRHAGLEVKRIANDAPKINAHAERCVRSIRELVGKHDLFYGEKPFLNSLREYEEYFNTERHHQGIDGRIPFPKPGYNLKTGRIKHKSRCNGKLGYYYRSP